MPHLIRSPTALFILAGSETSTAVDTDAGHQPKVRMIQWTQVLKRFCKGLLCIIRRPLCIFHILDYCNPFNVIQYRGFALKNTMLMLIWFIFIHYTQRSNWISFHFSSKVYILCRVHFHTQWTVSEKIWHISLRPTALLKTPFDLICF
jgi:hypothetical protein